jgi:Spy/CpxP family protein refolding chaperone
MKPWIKRTLFGVFGASILVGSLTACGHRQHDRGQMSQMSAEDAAKWRERMLERATKELQLDDAQKQRLGVVFDKMREQRNALVGSTTNPRAEMGALIAGATFDKARAQTLIEQKTGAVREKSPEVIAATADFFDTLKPEQQQKVREFLQRGGRHGWRG